MIFIVVQVLFAVFYRVLDKGGPYSLFVTTDIVDGKVGGTGCNIIGQQPSNTAQIPVHRYKSG